MRGAASCTLLGLVFAAACATPDGKVWNLKQVHDEQGNVRRTGAVLSDWEYAWAMGELGFEPRGLLSGLGDRTPDVERIDDPLGTALENLIELGEFDPADERVAGLQVEACTWLAVDASYRLTRERAVLELARHARRLGGVAPVRPDRAATKASPEAVTAALQALIDAQGSPLAGMGDRAPKEPRLPFDQALAAARGLDYDRDGARRALSLTTQLVASRAAPEEGEDRLRAWHVELQRTCVGLALGEALEDRESLVRASALRAAVEASANGMPQLLEAALASFDRPVMLVALEGIRRRGFPPALTEGQRRAWTDRLVFLASRRDGRIGAAACQALAVVAPEGPGSLRHEEWQAWWEDASAASGTRGASGSPRTSGAARSPWASGTSSSPWTSGASGSP